MRKRVGTILLLAGSAALVWCAAVWTSAALFERYEAWRWDARRVQTRTPASAPVVPGPHAPGPHDVIGWLDVPRLHISTAVLEGDDAFALGLGAGHIPGTSLPGFTGNVGIAAHRDSIFRPLRGIHPRDRIRLRTMEGEWEYTVESTRIVKPSNVGVLANHQQTELTLVTCYPFYYAGAAPLRFIVQARRAS